MIQDSAARNRGRVFSFLPPNIPKTGYRTHRNNLISTNVLIISEKEKLMKQKEEIENGCNCCAGDTALYWADAQNNAFINSHGEMEVMVKDHLIRFNVNRCPNCERVFSERRK